MYLRSALSSSTGQRVACICSIVRRRCDGRQRQQHRRRRFFRSGNIQFHSDRRALEPHGSSPYTIGRISDRQVCVCVCAFYMLNFSTICGQPAEHWLRVSVIRAHKTIPIGCAYHMSFAARVLANISNSRMRALHTPKPMQ